MGKFYITCALFGMLLCLGAASFTQKDLDYVADSLVVKVEVVDNLEFDGAKHLFHVTFYNSGNNVIRESNWTIYFYSFFMIESDHLPKEDSVILQSENIRLQHIQGCLFSLEPVSGFGDIESKGTKSLKFYGQNWAVSKSDIPPNWYIAAKDLEPRVIRSTTLAIPGFVSNFTLPKQWKRYKADLYNPFSPEDRYKRYTIEDLGKPGKVIIPTPREIRIDESKHVTLDQITWRVRSDAAFGKEAQFVSEKTNIPYDENSVPDITAKTLSLVTNTSLGSEEYYLLIDPTTDVIVIKGKSPAGVFYGVQSLLSLLAGSTDKRLPETEIRDQPRFGYRGMHIDVARNFHGKENIYRLLDAMAMYKMNKLHLHLTDDEGWRVEISDLPELTGIGSKRCHDLQDDICLIPQLGSGPGVNSSGSGFYTRKDYTNIVKYAKYRHIEVIPEIDVPGHARAAIKSMEARYKRLVSTAQPEADKFRLIDPNDTSKYLSVQMFNDNAVNPCVESTYRFVAKIVDDFIAMHNSTGQPLKTFHFGGDEVAVGAWENSTACDLIHVGNQTKREMLKRYFAQRVANITYERGLSLAGWEDGLMDENKNPYKRDLLANSEVLANAWDNVWEWGVAKRAYALANADYKVILSHATHLYFDHPYEPDPEERGLYWAPRFTDTFKAFSYNADDLYKNIDVRRSGEPITKQEVCGADNSGCPALKKRDNVIGMQGHLWSETVLTTEYFDYMIFPRILTIAERAWHKASWELIQDAESRRNETLEDWKLFANTLGYKELTRLEKLQINYRVSPPGAVLEGEIIRVNTEFPTLIVEYSSNYGNTWQPIPENYKPNDNILLRTRSTNGRRYSRAIKFLLPTDQLLLNYIAIHLHVKFSVIDNLANNGASFVQEIEMENQGTKIIREGTWSIYLFHIRLVEHTHFPYPDGYLIGNTGFRIFHITGSLYKLSPDPDTFKSIHPGQKLTLTFNAKYWQSARTDSMPNWYVIADGLEPRIIKSTEGESLDFVGPFNMAKQWKRFPMDKYDPYTPKTRYTINDNVQDLGKPGKHLLPTPYMMTIDEHCKVTITAAYWVIVKSDEFQNEVNYLADKIKLSQVLRPPTSMYIVFVKDSVTIMPGFPVNKEAYRLKIDSVNNIVTITANTSSGAFYGIQSLLRLSSKAPNGIEVPEADITDQPRFGYRGMHVDVGRNFHSVNDIKLLLNVMAMYKLNKFHFHLTDDEGWRLEIPGLEELTQVGSRRCHDLDEDSCILPQLGSGPNTESSGSGYYTVEEYRDILREAKKLHIDVIPEFDMPGHARAAVKSMEHRYRKYNTPGNMTSAKEFLLSEFGDPSKYLSVQFFDDNAVNPCLESTYKFIDTVIKTIKMLHEDIQPLTMFHFGGDEVAAGAWLNSTICQAFINSTSSLHSFTELKKYFVKNVAYLAHLEGLDIAAWEDGVMKNLTHPFDKNSLIEPSRNAYGFSWNNVFEWGSGDHAYVLANAGYKVVLAHATHLYFDHPYEPDPEERGYYWATRYTDTYKTFSYIPDDIYANAHFAVSGLELTPEQICKSECLKLEKPENIIGIQGALWSETVRTSSHLHYMIFPRLLALAERAWHKSEWENITKRQERTTKIQDEWGMFVNTVGYKDLRILDDMGVKYRVPPPGAVIENGRLKVNNRFPGLYIEYSTDNGSTWISALGNPIINERTIVKVRTRSADGTRMSRIITLPETPSKVSSSASTWQLSVISWIYFYILFVFLVLL